MARDADVRIAEGAAATNTPYVFSCQGCNPMEQTADAMGSTPFWYQLYWSTDEQLVDSMIGRAEKAGARALVVTLDTTTLGWRPQDLNLGSLPFSQGLGIAQYTSDPRFREIVREQVARRHRPRGEGAGHPRRDPHPGVDVARVPPAASSTTSARRSRGLPWSASSASTPTPA